MMLKRLLRLFGLGLVFLLSQAIASEVFAESELKADSPVRYRVLRKQKSDPNVPDFSVEAFRDRAGKIVKAKVQFDIRSAPDSQEGALDALKAMLADPSSNTFAGYVLSNTAYTTSELQPTLEGLEGVRLVLEVADQGLGLNANGKSIRSFGVMPIPFQTIDAIYGTESFGLSLGMIVFDARENWLDLNHRNFYLRLVQPLKGSKTSEIDLQIQRIR